MPFSRGDEWLGAIMTPMWQSYWWTPDSFYLQRNDPAWIELRTLRCFSVHAMCTGCAPVFGGRHDRPETLERLNSQYPLLLSPWLTCQCAPVFDGRHDRPETLKRLNSQYPLLWSPMIDMSNHLTCSLIAEPMFDMPNDLTCSLIAEPMFDMPNDSTCSLIAESMFLICQIIWLAG